jgi:hypothetical protein
LLDLSRRLDATDRQSDDHQQPSRIWSRHDIDNSQLLKQPVAIGQHEAQRLGHLPT